MNSTLRAKAPEGLFAPGQRTLVSGREILLALVRRELKVKYKRSVLGFFWSLVTPVLLTGVYLFVFIYVYDVRKPNFVPFLLSGMMPWQFFNMSLLTAANSLVDNASLIRKIYFPRYLIPMASVAANLINFLMGFAVLLVVLMATGREVWMQLHWLVLAIALESLLLVGASLALSIWNVYFRDIRQLIGIFSVVLFFATPVVYDLSRVPDRFMPIILANPMASIMEIYRAAIFYTRTPDLSMVMLGIAETALVFLLGMAVFRRQGQTIPKEL